MIVFSLEVDPAGCLVDQAVPGLKPKPPAWKAGTPGHFFKFNRFLFLTDFAKLCVFI